MMTLTEKRLNEIESKIPDAFHKILEHDKNIEFLKKHHPVIEEVQRQIENLYHIIREQKIDLLARLEQIKECVRYLEKKCEDIDKNILTLVREVELMKMDLSPAQSRISNLEKDLYVLRATGRQADEDIERLNDKISLSIEREKITTKEVDLIQKRLNIIDAKIESFPVEQLQKTVKQIVEYLPATKDKILNNDDITIRFCKIEKMLSNLVQNIMQGQLR